MSAQNSRGQKEVITKIEKCQRIDDEIMCIPLSTLDEFVAYFDNTHQLSKNLLFRVDGQVLQYIKHKVKHKGEGK